MIASNVATGLQWREPFQSQKLFCPRSSGKYLLTSFLCCCSASVDEEMKYLSVTQVSWSQDLIDLVVTGERDQC